MLTKRQFTLSDGEEITYGDSGSSVDGKPMIVLLPGQKKLPPGRLSGDFIEEQYNFFTDSFRIIMWNYRRNSAPGEKVNIPRLAKDLVEFLEAQKISAATLYAYSYGGMVAIRTAGIAPTRVKNLVLLNSFPYLSFSWFGFNGITLRFLLHLSVIPSASSSHIRESMYPGFRQKPIGYHGPLGKFFDWLCHHGLDVIWNHVWSERIWSALKDDVRPLLPHIKVPTLILGGRADAACTIESAEQFHQGLSRSELVILESAGHYTVRIWPEAFNQPIRDFLNRQYALSKNALVLSSTQPPAPLSTARILKVLMIQYVQWFRSIFRKLSP
jgi:pimeloyl-ACP methyl ester carboxylesterase